MVGHTHEDVDQLFSRISQRLHVEEAHTLPDLHRVTANAFTPAPEVIHLPSIWDIKPHLSEVGYCQGISTPHVFKFTLRDDRVIMHYKDWPLASEPYRHEDVTEMCMDLCQRLVPVSPNPKVDPILKQMNDDLEKWARSGRLSREEIAWWQTYLSDLKESAGSRPVIPLPSQLGHFSTSRPTATLSSNLMEALRRASEKLNRVSTVSLSYFQLLKPKLQWSTHGLCPGNIAHSLFIYKFLFIDNLCSKVMIMFKNLFDPTSIRWNSYLGTFN